MVKSKKSTPIGASGVDTSGCGAMEGLMKKKNSRGQWKDRYAKLSNAFFITYKPKGKQPTSEVKECVDLAWAESVDVVNGNLEIRHRTPTGSGGGAAADVGGGTADVMLSTLTAGSDGATASSSSAVTAGVGGESELCIFSGQYIELWADTIQERADWAKQQRAVELEERRRHMQQTASGAALSSLSAASAGSTGSLSALLGTADSVEDGHAHAQSDNNDLASIGLGLSKKVHISGWLMKKSHNKYHGFQDRYVRVEGQYLRYYKKEPPPLASGDSKRAEKEELGSADIETAEFVRPYDSSPDCRVFELHDDRDRVFVFQAKTNADMLRWIDVLESIRVLARKERLRREQALIAAETPARVLLYDEEGETEFMKQISADLAEIYPDIPTNPEIWEDKYAKEDRKKEQKRLRAEQLAAAVTERDEDREREVDIEEDEEEEEEETAGAMEPLSLREHISCAQELVGYLHDFLPDVEMKPPNRPRNRYDILATMIVTVNKTIVDRFAPILLHAAEPGKRHPVIERAVLGDLYALIQWITKYQQTLRAISCPSNVLPNHLKYPKNCPPLFEDFLRDVCSVYVYGGTTGAKGGAAAHLFDHCQRVFDSLLRSPDEMIQRRKDGSFFTNAPVGMWEAINSHIQLATATESPILHVMIADKTVQSLNQVVTNITAYVNSLRHTHYPELKEVELEFVCALANDTAVHIEEAIELIENFSMPEIRDRIDEIFDSLTTNLVQCGQACLKRLASLVMGDVQSLIDEVFTEKWLDGNQMHSATATLSDYMQDFEQFLVKFWAEKFVHTLLEEVILGYTRSVVFHKPPASSSTAGAAAVGATPATTGSGSPSGRSSGGSGVTDSSSNSSSSPRRGFFASFGFSSIKAEIKNVVIAGPPTRHTCPVDADSLGRLAQDVNTLNAFFSRKADQETATEFLELINEVSYLLFQDAETISMRTISQISILPSSAQAIYETAVACLRMRDDVDKDEIDFFVEQLQPALGETAAEAARLNEQNGIAEGRLGLLYNDLVPEHLLLKANNHLLHGGKVSLARRLKNMAHLPSLGRRNNQGAVDGSAAGGVGGKIGGLVEEGEAAAAAGEGGGERGSVKLNLVGEVMDLLNEQEQYEEELVAAEEQERLRIEEERNRVGVLSYEGYLEKKSPGHNLWQRRWFRLSTRETGDPESPYQYTLMWYKKEGGTVLKALHASNIKCLKMIHSTRPLAYSLGRAALVLQSEAQGDPHALEVRMCEWKDLSSVLSSSRTASASGTATSASIGTGTGTGSSEAAAVETGGASYFAILQADGKEHHLRSLKLDRVIKWTNILAKAAGLAYDSFDNTWNRQAVQYHEEQLRDLYASQPAFLHAANATSISSITSGAAGSAAGGARSRTTSGNSDISNTPVGGTINNDSSSSVGDHQHMFGSPKDLLRSVLSTDSFDQDDDDGDRGGRDRGNGGEGEEGDGTEFDYDERDSMRDSGYVVDAGDVRVAEDASTLCAAAADLIQAAKHDELVAAAAKESEEGEEGEGEEEEGGEERILADQLSKVAMRGQHVRVDRVHHQEELDAAERLEAKEREQAARKREEQEKKQKEKEREREELRVKEKQLREKREAVRRRLLEQEAAEEREREEEARLAAEKRVQEEKVRVEKEAENAALQLRREQRAAAAAAFIASHGDHTLEEEEDEENEENGEGSSIQRCSGARAAGAVRAESERSSGDSSSSPGASDSEADHDDDDDDDGVTNGAILSSAGKQNEMAASTNSHGDGRTALPKQTTNSGSSPPGQGNESSAGELTAETDGAAGSKSNLLSRRPTARARASAIASTKSQQQQQQQQDKSKGKEASTALPTADMYPPASSPKSMPAPKAGSSSAAAATDGLSTSARKEIIGNPIHSKTTASSVLPIPAAAAASAATATAGSTGFAATVLSGGDSTVSVESPIMARRRTLAAEKAGSASKEGSTSVETASGTSSSSSLTSAALPSERPALGRRPLPTPQPTLTPVEADLRTTEQSDNSNNSTDTLTLYAEAHTGSSGASNESKAPQRSSSIARKKPPPPPPVLSSSSGVLSKVPSGDQEGSSTGMMGLEEKGRRGVQQRRGTADIRQKLGASPSLPAGLGDSSSSFSSSAADSAPPPPMLPPPSPRSPTKRLELVPRTTSIEEGENEEEDEEGVYARKRVASSGSSGGDDEAGGAYVDGNDNKSSILSSSVRRRARKSRISSSSGRTRRSTPSDPSADGMEHQREGGQEEGDVCDDGASSDSDDENNMKDSVGGKSLSALLHQSNRTIGAPPLPQRLSSRSMGNITLQNIDEGREENEEEGEDEDEDGKDEQMHVQKVESAADQDSLFLDASMSQSLDTDALPGSSLLSSAVSSSASDKAPDSAEVCTGKGGEKSKAENCEVEIRKVPGRFAGMLWKKSPNVMKGYQQRYTVLQHPGEIAYYSSEAESVSRKSDPKGLVRIADLVPSRRDAVELMDTGSSSSSGSNLFTIKLAVGGKVLQMKAPSHESAVAWIHAIGEWIDFVHASSSSSRLL